MLDVKGGDVRLWATLAAVFCLRKFGGWHETGTLVTRAEAVVLKEVRLKPELLDVAELAGGAAEFEEVVHRADVASQMFRSLENLRADLTLELLKVLLVVHLSHVAKHLPADLEGHGT